MSDPMLKAWIQGTHLDKLDGSPPGDAPGAAGGLWPGPESYTERTASFPPREELQGPDALHPSLAGQTAIARAERSSSG